MILPTYKIYLRPDQIKNGTRMLYIRLTLSRKHKYVSLNIRLNPNNWDEKAQRVRRSEKDHSSLNRLIQSYITRANDIIYDYSLRNKYLSLDEFKHKFDIAYNTKSVYDYVDNELLKNMTVAPDTKRAYVSQYNKLKGFKSELLFQELDISFINSYERYLKVTLKNSHNTIVNAFKFLKIVCKQGIEAGLLENNPFDNKKYSFKESDRERLTLVELNRLDVIYERDDTNIKYKKVLKYFLFSCYTGLRFGDMQKLRHSDIDDGFINIKMNKTQKGIRIPIVNAAKKYISENGRNYDHIFKTYDNIVTNRYLKDIMVLAGIKKTISFHCARHSFATNALELGVSMELISALLGHSNVRITRIYAKYNDKLKSEGLSKFDTENGDH